MGQTRMTIFWPTPGFKRKYLSQLWVRTQESGESRGGRPELPVPNNPYGLWGHKATLNLNLSTRTELRSCVKVEVAVLSSPSLIILMVSVDACKATLEEEEFGFSFFRPPLLSSFFFPAFQVRPLVRSFLLSVFCFIYLALFSTNLCAVCWKPLIFLVCTLFKKKKKLFYFNVMSFVQLVCWFGWL